MGARWWRLITGVTLILGLLGPGWAQSEDPWQAPSPQRTEHFLEVFVPDLIPSQDLSAYSPLVARLVAISRAWERGDRLETSDLILVAAAGDLEPLTEARERLQAARTLSLWWNDREARGHFQAFYREVYLKDPTLAESEEAFATRFLQGASTRESQEPARFLYEHLDRFGYAAANGLTPAGHLWRLMQTYDLTLTDAARLGLPQDQMIDLSLYRNAVITRLVTQIEAARRFADSRLGGIEGWGGIIAPAVTEGSAPASGAPAPEVHTAPAVETEEEGVDLFLLPPAGEEPATLPQTRPVPDVETVYAEPPAPVEEEVIPEVLLVDIFRLPDDQEPRPAPAAESDAPLDEDETVTVEESPIAPAAPGTDPEVFGPADDPEVAFGSNPADDTASAIEPLEDPETIFTLPGSPEVEPAPEPAVEEEVLLEDARDPGLSEEEREAARQAGQAALEESLRQARSIGEQTTDLVLLWNAPDRESAEVQKAEEALTGAFRQTKDRLLASLYLLDIYGVHARLQLEREELDARLLDALYSDYHERKDLNEEAVVRLMMQIEASLRQLEQGIRDRTTSDTVAAAQQRAFDGLKSGPPFAALAAALESTLAPE